MRKKWIIINKYISNRNSTKAQREWVRERNEEIETENDILILNDIDRGAHTIKIFVYF